jgi:aryl-alcohol dehydrogenase-like predicted oxidoreductase
MKFSLMSRRDVLRVGAVTIAGLGMGRMASAAEKDRSRLAPITKPIPSTGEQIPVIGLGTNQYSVEKREEMAGLQEVLETMVKLGGSVVDTARVYGRAEEVIGELVERMGNRNRFFIATKTPIQGKLRAPDTEIQASFDRLRVKTIDLMLIHNLHGLHELMPAFLQAKKQGRIRYIGMSTSVEAEYAAQMEGMRRYPLDFIQVDYSIANRAAAHEILPLAEAQGIAVLVNMPFGGRGAGAAAIFGRVGGRALPDWAAGFDATSWAQLFLKYVVSHPAVTAAIPGTTRVAHLVDNQGAGTGRLPDAAMRRKIEHYWDSL